MKRTLTALALAVAASSFAHSASAQEPGWRKVKLTDKFYAEGMAAGVHSHG